MRHLLSKSLKSSFKIFKAASACSSTFRFLTLKFEIWRGESHFTAEKQILNAFCLNYLIAYSDDTLSWGNTHLASCEVTRKYRKLLTKSKVIPIIWVIWRRKKHIWRPIWHLAKTLKTSPVLTRFRRQLKYRVLVLFRITIFLIFCKTHFSQLFFFSHFIIYLGLLFDKFTIFLLIIFYFLVDFILAFTIILELNLLTFRFFLGICLWIRLFFCVIFFIL